MIALRAIPLLTGQTVLVKVVPVDPRELFRGDYVQLSYDFSRVPPERCARPAGELGLETVAVGRPDRLRAPGA